MAKCYAEELKQKKLSDEVSEGGIWPWNMG